MEQKIVDEICQLVSKETGIILGEEQQDLVNNRLKRRLAQLKIATINEYLDYLNGNPKKEIPALISLMTTHTTFFFREFPHFEFLANGGLQKIVEELKKSGKKTVKVWSAACSKGHEVYSLAMFIDFHLKEIDPSFSFEIWGSDVDEMSVKFADNGVYLWKDLKEAPAKYLSNHWKRGSAELEDFVRIGPELKSKCKFKTVNLTKISDGMPASENFDVIFCRNVFIYFSKENINSISNNLLKHLNPHGYLFLGMSESLDVNQVPAKAISPSIYIHTEFEEAAKKSLTEINKEKKPVKVFCVDDSNTILLLLKKIFDKEHGFEVVGTAVNGIDAMEKTKNIEFDVMTLDIHMPEMDGIGYLKMNYNEEHPPVVMVTTVTMEDKEFGLNAIELGASDFIEKPSLSDVSKRGDEIRNKVKSVLDGSKGFSKSIDLVKSFTPDDKHDAGDKMIGIFAEKEDLVKIKIMLGMIKEMGAPIVIAFYDTRPEQIDAIVDQFNSTGTLNVKKEMNALGSLDKDSIYVVPNEVAKKFYEEKGKNYHCLGCVYGDVDRAVIEMLNKDHFSYVILEDIGTGTLSKIGKSGDHGMVDEYLPYTSFTYTIKKYLNVIKI